MFDGVHRGVNIYSPIGGASRKDIKTSLFSWGKKKRRSVTSLNEVEIKSETETVVEEDVPVTRRRKTRQKYKTAVLLDMFKNEEGQESVTNQNHQEPENTIVVKDDDEEEVVFSSTRAKTRPKFKKTAVIYDLTSDSDEEVTVVHNLVNKDETEQTKVNVPINPIKTTQKCRELSIKLIRLSPGDIVRAKNTIKSEINHPPEVFESIEPEPGGDNDNDVDRTVRVEADDEQIDQYNCNDTGAELSTSNPNPSPEPSNSDERDSAMVELLVDENRERQMGLLNADFHNNEVYIPSVSVNNLASFAIPSIMPEWEEHPGVHWSLTGCPPTDIHMGYLHIKPKTLRPLDVEFDKTLMFWVLNHNITFRSAGSNEPTPCGKNVFMYPSNFPPGGCIIVPPRTYFIIENHNETEVATLGVVKIPTSDPARAVASLG